MPKFLVTVSLHFEIEADSENEAQDIANEVVHVIGSTRYVAATRQVAGRIAAWPRRTTLTYRTRNLLDGDLPEGSKYISGEVDSTEIKEGK